mmetsp:Transcript_44111/g.133672  ORF Transcript_44111/g.133672 Transcript_44111/m.133672 type:complete len:264 (-) Transcript_44111:409-1200(-)
MGCAASKPCSSTQADDWPPNLKRKIRLSSMRSWSNRPANWLMRPSASVHWSSVHDVSEEVITYAVRVTFIRKTWKAIAKNTNDTEPSTNCVAPRLTQLVFAVEITLCGGQMLHKNSWAPHLRSPRTSALVRKPELMNRRPRKRDICAMTFGKTIRKKGTFPANLARGEKSNFPSAAAARLLLQRRKTAPLKRTIKNSDTTMTHSIISTGAARLSEANLELMQVSPPWASARQMTILEPFSRKSTASVWIENPVQESQAVFVTV